MTGSRLTRPRIVSKAALPLPTIMAARRVVTGTPAEASRSPVSRRLRRGGVGPGAPPGGEPLPRLAAAAQMRRRAGAVGAEPAEVDDLPHACVGRFARDRLRCRAVLLLEVLGAERVDEVVDHLGTFQGRGDAVAPRGVGYHPAGAGLVTRGARDR